MPETSDRLHPQDNSEKEIQPNIERIVTFGNCLRFIDTNLDRLRNDVNYGIAPSLRYGVKRNGGYEAVSVTAFSRNPTAASRLERAAHGNEFFTRCIKEMTVQKAKVLYHLLIS